MGIALLLSIFVLLLVAVVGIAMMAASGTEVSLSGNYRSSTATYYAALSGLEEGRGRLLPRNPNYLGVGGYIPPIGTLLPLGHVIYIRNPLPGDPASTIDPTNLGNPATFPDTDYAREFPSQNPPSNVKYAPSVATITNPANTPNPPYKWVRINALTEYALQIDVNYTSGNTTFNKTQPVYFDGTNLTRTVSSYQALGVTALAALPDGSRKLLQYVVAPIKLSLQFNAALTLEGPGSAVSTVTFVPPPNPGLYSFQLYGSDQCSSPPPAPQPPVPAIGVLNSYDLTAVQNAIATPPPPQPQHTDRYQGTTLSNNVVIVSPSVPINWQDPVQLTKLVTLIQGGADSVLTGPATEANMPSGMSSSNPMTVVVNGDLTLNSFTGYGILVVTGTFNYSGDTNWKGIILVIGQGVVNEFGSSDLGEIDGAVFVANTTGGNLGPATYNLASPGGHGIFYNSCWIANVQKPTSYKVLAFHEIPYP